MLATPMRARGGMSLIEVTIAIGVLAMAISVMIGSMATANQVTTRSMGQTRVLEGILKVLEGVQATSFDVVQSTWNQQAISVDMVESYNQTAPIMVSVQAVSNTLLRVRVNASWRDLQGPQQLAVDFYQTRRN